MVAIVLIRHEVNAANNNLQWSGEELAEILNDLPLAQQANFHVNSLALKQGFLIFKRYFVKWGITTIDMYQDEKKTLPFFDLVESRRSIELKFGTYHSMSEDSVESDVSSEILNIRDKLLSLGGYEKSIHNSPCSVFGSLYLPIVTISSPLKITPKSSPEIKTEFITNQYKVRKSSPRLGKRAIYNSTKKILSSALKSFGDQHALFYMESAVEKLKKRKLSELDDSENNDEVQDSEEESDEDDNVILLEDDDRVVDAASNFKMKYVKYTEDDKTDILSLFGVITEVAKEKNIKNYRLIAARTTALLLKENKYYSKLSARTISRWNDLTNINKMTRGRKINEDFEGEVWGKLMFSVFEKVTT